MVMPRAGEGAHGGPAKFKHGWIPVSPGVAASMDRIRVARDAGKVKVQNYSTMSGADKVRAAETMYGTGSPQHKAASARFTPEVAATVDRIRRARSPRNPTSLGESVQPNIAELTAGARGGGLPYSAAFITMDGRFTPEREALHRKIIEAHLAGIKPSGKQPVQYMNGGGPGSGKSSLRAGDNARLTGYPPTREVHEMTGEVDTSQSAEAVLIDPDAVKMMLPEVKAARNDPNSNWAAKAHEESSYLAKRIHQAALDRGLDLVYDGTGDSGVDSVLKKAGKARAAGYRVEGNYIYLDPDEGVRRAEIRAKRTGRAVPEDVIRYTYENVSDTFVALAQRGSFDVLRVFDNNQARGVPAKPIAEFHGPQPDIHDPAAYGRFLTAGSPGK